jgi:hypothetical protein
MRSAAGRGGAWMGEALIDLRAICSPSARSGKDGVHGPLPPPAFICPARSKQEPTCWSQRIKPIGSMAVAKPLFPSEVWEKACTAIHQSLRRSRRSRSAAVSATAVGGHRCLTNILSCRSRRRCCGWDTRAPLAAAAPRCVHLRFHVLPQGLPSRQRMC